MLESIESIVSKCHDSVSWDEYFMSISLLASARSKCKRLKVGCAIVKDNRVVSTGYNGFLSRRTTRIHSCERQRTGHRTRRAQRRGGRRKERGFLNNSTAYVTHYPCLNCAKPRGVAWEIKYNREYRNDPLVERVVGRSVAPEPMRIEDQK